MPEQERRVSESWDAQYGRGRYAGEGPVGFAGDIVSALKRRGSPPGRGLYVGCGNGRNYVPLSLSGLDMVGIDVSPVAIDQLSRRHPSLSGRLHCTDFGRFESDEPFDFVVAIQAFQHGTESGAAAYFDRAAGLLRRGGLLFCRVNSSSTQIRRGHAVVEKGPHGGFTVRYAEGPKEGLDIHFFSERELTDRLSGAGFGLVSGPDEKTMPRVPPETGTWSQWEVVAEKG